VLFPAGAQPVEGSAVGSLDGSPILSTSASPVRWPATPRTSRQCFTLALPPAPEPASGRLAGTRSDGCWVRLGSGVPMRSGVAWSTAADAAPSPTARLIWRERVPLLAAVLTVDRKTVPWPSR